MKSTPLWPCLLTIALCLPAGSCGEVGQPEFKDYSTPELMALLPADARVVFALDAQSMFTEEYFRKLVEPPNQTPPAEDSLPQQYESFKKKTGIDWREDVRRVVGAAAGDPSAREVPLAVLVNVRHDPERILAVVDTDDAVERRPALHGSHTLHELYSRHGETREFITAFAFLDDSLMVFGTPSEIKKVLDRLDPRPVSPGFSKKLAGLVAQADQQAMVWVAMSFDADMQEVLPNADELPFRIPLKLESIEGFTGAVDYRNFILNGDFRVLSADAATNEQMAALLNGLRAMAAMREGATGKLMNTLLITADAHSIRLSFNIPEDLLQELAAELKNQTVPFMDMPQFGTPSVSPDRD
ncbi:MAG: hypothetical protein JXQ27_00495 [Acidobacteria bacterium]|nr:hypothetical protein [Acidobacteriota bacterium]